MADSARAQLQAAIQRLRELPDRLVEESAPEVADAFKAELTTNIAGSHGPDGEAWAPKKDGGKPLAHAAAALDVKAIGTLIVATLTGPEVLHNKGFARGGVKRQILPTRKIPVGVVRVIEKVFRKKWAELNG